MASFENGVQLEKAIIHYKPSRPLATSSDSHTLTSSSLQELKELPYSTLTSTTPSPPHFKHLLRQLRYTLFTVYRRLFTLIFLANLTGAILLLFHSSSDIDTINPSHLATFSSTNFLLAILIRHDFAVNLLFRSAWLVPWSTPLRLRHMIARVYAYGAAHSGAAVAGSMWFLLFTALVTTRSLDAGGYAVPVLAVTWGILVLLTLILLLAMPQVRVAYHDVFEMSHRFLGWASIALFWAELVLLTREEAAAPISSSSGSSTPSSSPASRVGSRQFWIILLAQPTFYNLLVITVLLVYPWLLLRKWTFRAEKLSSHAVRLHFTHPVHRFSCLSVSNAPLREWHPFATFPDTDEEGNDGNDGLGAREEEEGQGAGKRKGKGASIIISSAGDWTRSLIASIPSVSHPSAFALPPASDTLTLYTRGHPRAGVLSLTTLFPRIVLFTTGSGIGPSLSSLLDRPTGQFARLIWSTRSPVGTFGEAILRDVRAVDPQAVILDTSAPTSGISGRHAGHGGDVRTMDKKTGRMGHKQLVRLCEVVAAQVRAEAVFVLSNKALTGKVVGGLEQRGVRAYGPIWDS